MKIACYSPGIKRKEMDAVLTVMVDEKIGPGEQAQRFLALAKEKIGYEYALSLRSPAIALYIALSAIFRQPDGAETPAAADKSADKSPAASPAAASKPAAAVSALCPPYYAGVLHALGLSPLYCDTAPGSACISAETVRAARERSGAAAACRCIIVSETLGMMPDMEALKELGLPLIEDASLSYGSALNGKAAGTFGIFTILGLEERGMLTAGGGALLFTMDKRAASVLRGFSALPPELALADMNAAMAIVQLREQAKNLARRGEIAEAYTRAALQSRHKLFALPDGFEYNNYAFPLILETGVKDVQNYAKRKEIDVELAFSGNTEETPAKGGLSESASLSLRAALFPLYPRLSGKDVERVVKLIHTLP